jgi:Na+-translocating ferredoxin:NAD+ oxidoreductase RnfC subunit
MFRTELLRSNGDGMTTTKDIQDWGVVGAGGAGFPSHVKYNAKAEIVVVNAAECEPLLHKDKEILKFYGQQVVSGLAEVMKLTGAPRGIFGIKGKYKDVVAHIKTLLKPGMEVFELGNFYPAGDEITLVYETTGRVVAPGNIPLSAGCVVTNVETLLNVARAQSVTTTFMTVAGAVNNPISVEVAVGSRLGDVIDLAGGSNCSDPVLLVGGPMMGKYSEDWNQPVTKTTGGVIVLPRDHVLAKKYSRPRNVYEKIAKSSCDQCSFCTELCPRFLLGHPIEPHKNMRNQGFKTTNWQLVKGAEFCCECNLCSFFSCPEDLDPKNVSSDMKRRVISEAENRMKFAPGSVKEHPMIRYRKAPLPKLMKKIGLDQFVNKGELVTGVFSSSVVRIPLSQHIGAPAEAVVKEGQSVKAGQLIGKAPEGKLSTNIHASKSGVVVSVTDVIEIRG